MTYHTSKGDEKTDATLEQTVSNHVGEIRDFDPGHDAVFGELGDDGPDYRAVRSQVQPHTMTSRLMMNRSDGWAVSPS